MKSKKGLSDPKTLETFCLESKLPFLFKSDKAAAARNTHFERSENLMLLLLVVARI